MGTTITRPAINPDILEERWRMATTRPQRWGEGLATTHISQDNSKAVERIFEAVETLGARLVEEVHEEELGGLGELAGDLVEGPIKDALYAWAQGIEAARRIERRALEVAR